MNTRVITVVLIALVIFSLGCSGTTPTSPATQLLDSEKKTSSSSGNILWGIWDLTFNPDDLSVQAVYDRTAMGHFDVTSELIPPNCNDCLQILVNSYSPGTGIVDADVTLKNPKPLKGRDVRGILYTNQFGHIINNPDDWTPVYDITGGSDHNPFRAYAKSETNRIFNVGASHTENFLVWVPTPPKFQLMKYAVTASWPGNCKEPYMIDAFQQLDEIPAYEGASGVVEVSVYDWQNDIDSVRLYAQAING